MTSENNTLPLNLQEVDKKTGEVVKLDVNSTSTVQPVALMRLGLFVPTLKSTGKSKANCKNVTDASEELVQLSIAKSEGYTMSGSQDRVWTWIRTLKSGLGSFAPCQSMA
jgi:hypothetical protein